MASNSDINSTTFNNGKADGELLQFEKEDNAKLSEAEQYADDLARELINDTDQVANHEHSGLIDLSTEAIETTPALSGVDYSISEHQPQSATIAELVDDQPNLLSLSHTSTASKPSAIIANTPLYFDEDSLEHLTHDIVDGIDLQPDKIKKEEAVEEVKEEEKQTEEDKGDTEEEEEELKLPQQEQEQQQIPQQSEDVEEETREEEQEEETEPPQPQQHEEDKLIEEEMEFTKNYSDDLLMGQRGGESDQRATNTDDIGGGITGSGGPDLADFELPPYSGSSSSGSEQAAATTTTTTTTSSDKQKQQSPTTSNPNRKYSSSSSSHHQSTTAAAASSVAVPDLTALKKLLTSSYSKISHVFHWKRPIESGIFFATGLTVIIALTFFSIISVVAYSALGIILTSGLIRVYKTSMKTLNRPSETPVDHIWEKVLNLNVSMSSEKMHELIDASHANINSSLVYIKQVLLVEDKLATFKFGFILYLLTYIGAWFNGLTLITICYLSLFSVPLVYEKNKAKIDEYLNLATSQLCSTVSMVTNKVTALAFGSSSGDSKKQN